jgi:hypothetical protein
MHAMWIRGAFPLFSLPGDSWLVHTSQISTAVGCYAGLRIDVWSISCPKNHKDKGFFNRKPLHYHPYLVTRPAQMTASPPAPHHQIQFFCNFLPSEHKISKAILESLGCLFKFLWLGFQMETVNKRAERSSVKRHCWTTPKKKMTLINKCDAERLTASNR